MVEERNNLLSDHDKNQASKARDIESLTSELALWRGKADPEDVWPPKPPDETRRQILAELFGGRLQDMAKTLTSEPSK